MTSAYCSGQGQVSLSEGEKSWGGGEDVQHLGRQGSLWEGTSAAAIAGDFVVDDLKKQDENVSEVVRNPLDMKEEKQFPTDQVSLEWGLRNWGWGSSNVLFIILWCCPFLRRWRGSPDSSLSWRRKRRKRMYDFNLLKTRSNSSFYPHLLWWSFSCLSRLWRRKRRRGRMQSRFSRSHTQRS